MAKTEKIKGELSQFEEPVWLPLAQLVGFEVMSDFMWMNEVELADGRKIQAYKHKDTRRYIHLDQFSRAYAYLGNDRYQRYSSASVLRTVFASLGELHGGTERRMEMSHKAWERALDHDEYLEDNGLWDHTPGEWTGKPPADDAGGADIKAA